MSLRNGREWHRRRREYGEIMNPNTISQRLPVSLSEYFPVPIAASRLPDFLGTAGVF